ncbi:MAG: cytidylate kinase-like family protein [Bacteroidota bacterium]
MKILSAYEKARVYIEKHSEEDIKLQKRRQNPGPIITISRETGVGANAICNKLVDYLNNFSIKDYNDWTYFDKDLINKVMEDHNLPSHFKKYLEEEKVPRIEGWFSEILGISPSKISLLHKTSKTILRIAEFGDAIIIGRGANIILANHPKTFHIRLVAPENFRIENAMELYGIDRKTAAEFIRKEDLARKDFISKYFHKNIEDPLSYHVTINTNLLKPGEIAEMIGHCVIKRFSQFFELQED